MRWEYVDIWVIMLTEMGDKMGKNNANQSLLTQKLQQIRLKHGISYADWAVKSGVPKSTLSRFLSSSLNMPNFPAVCAMLKCLGESIDAFYDSIDAKIDVPAEALKLDVPPADILGDIPVDIPEEKAEIQELIIRQTEELQRMKAEGHKKDLRIEMLEVRLETTKRIMEAIKALCEPK